MNDLVKIETRQTMSSKEIAELTGKQHKHVMADVRNMLEKLGLESAEFSAVYKDQQLIDRPCYALDRELTLTLVSGYDIPLRHRVVTRLAELERNQTPKTYKAALLALVASIEAQEKAEAEVAQLTEALDRDFSYVSILRASSFAGVKETVFDWRVLKDASVKMGCPPKKVPSPRYEYQNLYPIAAFRECYPQYNFNGLTPDGVSTIKRLRGE